MLSRLCSWLWLSWRPGTSALLCSTVKRPSWLQREPSLTRHSSTSSTFPMTRSSLSTYHSSCPCVCLSCCHCSKLCLRLDRDAKKSKPRRTECDEQKTRYEQTVLSVALMLRYKGSHKERLICSIGGVGYTNQSCMIFIVSCKEMCSF